MPGLSHTKRTHKKKRASSLPRSNKHHSKTMKKRRTKRATSKRSKYGAVKESRNHSPMYENNDVDVDQSDYDSFTE